ncbi:hypothetical protein [Neorhodopirellula lusitana]|uniref:hypothetical protein n=1 Tax=Neorhodopirellula lusitana TaxID=445327 RepID=UPI00384FB3D5
MILLDHRSRSLFLSTAALWLGLSMCWVQPGSAQAEMLTREGVHLRLTSDVANEATLDEFVSSFDAAVPQWCEFWGVPTSQISRWKIDGYLMRNESTFRSMGVLPANVPKFRYGFASPAAIWIHQQSTAHSNRHLILHEGVHALAIKLFGGGGPSWYMEGTAELLATHRDRQVVSSARPAGLLAQASNRFLINDLPQTRQESPMWGRYRVVDEARHAQRLPTLASVMKLPINLAGEVESYTWCWAAALMLTHYPDTREVFIKAARNGSDQTPAFTTKVYRQLQQQWPVIRARWQLWLNDLEYGFDPESSQVELSVDDPRYNNTRLTSSIDSKLGWQSMGAWFNKGTRLKVQGTGSCVIVDENSVETDAEDLSQTRDWTSGPDGVTVKYHRGQPIGQLQWCVLPIPSPEAKSLSPLEIGSVSSNETVIVEIKKPSWLLFRIHDIPGHNGRYQRSDNRGSYEVVVSP